MDKKYDFIVIGSGIGGLTAASLLSRDNKTLVLEKNRVPGGYCTDFTRDGFRFEAAVQAINGLNREGIAGSILKRAGALEGVKFIKAKNLYRSIFPDHDIVVPQRDLEGYKGLLFSLYPEEKAGIAGLFDIMKSIYTEVDRLVKEKSLKKSPFLLKYYHRTLKDLLDDFIANEKLKAIISQYWIYRGLPPAGLSCAIFSYIWYDYTVNGSYFPEDGMHRIIGNMKAAIERNGGEVLADSEVSGLLMKHNRVSRAALKNGRELSAGAFISNIDIYKTFGMLDDAGRGLTETFLKKLQDNSLSISAFKIYLGLDADARELGIDDFEVFMNPSYDMDRMYQASLSNDCENTALSLTAYSNISGAFCDKGRSVISVGMLSAYDFWRGLSPSEYRRIKEETTDAVLSRCERIFPGLRRHIRVKISATPLTMERYTNNSNGSIYGWSQKSLAEQMKFMNPTTPIKNLYLSSQWTKIGGGITGVLLSSDRLCAYLKKRIRK